MYILDSGLPRCVLADEPSTTLSARTLQPASRAHRCRSYFTGQRRASVNVRSVGSLLKLSTLCKSIGSRFTQWFSVSMIGGSWNCITHSTHHPPLSSRGQRAGVLSIRLFHHYIIV